MQRSPGRCQATEPKKPQVHYFEPRRPKPAAGPLWARLQVHPTERQGVIPKHPFIYPHCVVDVYILSNYLTQSTPKQRLMRQFFGDWRCEGEWLYNGIVVNAQADALIAMWTRQESMVMRLDSLIEGKRRSASSELEGSIPSQSMPRSEPATTDCRE